MNTQGGKEHANPEPLQWRSGSSEGLGALLKGTSAVDVGMGEQCSTTSPAHLFPTWSGIEPATLRFGSAEALTSRPGCPNIPPGVDR